MQVAAAAVAAHLAGGGTERRLLGTLGWEMPDWQSLPMRDLGGGNRLFTACPDRLVTVACSAGARDNIVIVEGARNGPVKINLNGTGNLAVVRESRKFQCLVTMGGTGNLFFAGLGTTANEANIVVGVGGADTALLLGADCLISQRVNLRATDSHGMLDVRSGALINQPQSIVVHPHVWIGHGVTVLKGVTIGAGAIVGASAVVSADLPPLTASAGAPARVLRRDTTWTRRPEPGAAEWQAVLDLMRGLGVLGEDGAASG